MKKEMIFSICLILVAIIGFGCVSAADNSTSGVDDLNQMTVDENTEHVDVNQVSENNDADDMDSQVSLNSTDEGILDVNSQKTARLNDDNTIKADTFEQDKDIISTSDYKLHPGNGFSVEDERVISKLTKFYKEHNYSLKDLYIELGSYITIENRDDFDRLANFMSVIHNDAMIERGYGQHYSKIEMYDQIGLIIARAILEM